jgi:cell division transport system permease protein
MTNRSLTILKRTILAGFTGFYRNKTVSISSISILTTTLMIIGIFFFFRAISDYTLSEIKNKVDIKIYFKVDATDAQINDIKDKIITLPQIKSTSFVSAEDALSEFRKKHANDQITLQALEELNSNPFGATLSVVAQNTTDYDLIFQSLNSDSSFLGDTSTVIDKINYFQLKGSIDKLNNIIGFINTIGY